MAEFPTNLVPTSRAFNPGDWPVRRFNAESGAEIRILRGSNRLGSQLELSYDNIPDSEAEKFLKHYRAVQGSFRSWHFPPKPADGGFVSAFKGWGATDSTELEAFPWGMAWRYDGPPQITQVKKGVSNVSLKLLGVAVESSTITSTASPAPTPPTPAATPRFATFYGVEWATTPDRTTISWAVPGYIVYAAPPERVAGGVPRWRFELPGGGRGLNTSPGLRWSLVDFATTPTTFQIVCVDATRSGSSKITTTPAYEAAIKPYQSKFLHWNISGPASSVTTTGGYRILRNDNIALPTSWTAASLEPAFDSYKGSANGWLGPFPDDAAEHQYVFVITAFDGSGNALANGICASVATFKVS